MTPLGWRLIREFVVEHGAQHQNGHTTVACPLCDSVVTPDRLVVCTAGREPVVCCRGCRNRRALDADRLLPARSPHGKDHPHDH